MGAVMRLRAFAKVNYALVVQGLRGDGYHDVATVMQSISLADELEIEFASEGFELVVEPEQAEVGPSESNTVYRAWRLLSDSAGRKLPTRIRLGKNIPSGAGLGGASADAAAALIGLNEMFSLGLSVNELQEIGKSVGADVPFCIAGGTSVGEGIGDVLTELPPPPEHHIVILKPEIGAETAHIYRAYDERAPESYSAESVGQVIKALGRGDLGSLARSLGNDLAPITGDLLAEVRKYERELLGSGALGSCMSGTGTAVYGLFDDAEAARAAAARSAAYFSDVYEPVSSGVNWH